MQYNKRPVNEFSDVDSAKSTQEIYICMAYKKTLEGECDKSRDDWFLRENCGVNIDEYIIVQIIPWSRYY